MAETHTIQSDSIVDLFFHLKWNSKNAVHTDGYHASRVNIWRDVLPKDLMELLKGKGVGDRLKVPLQTGDIVSSFREQNRLRIKNNQFNRFYHEGFITEPRPGRFYPKGLLTGIAGVFKANIQPFRCIGANNGHLTVDLNHPLSEKALDLSVIVGKIDRNRVERGGTSHNWMEILAAGPGMQARWENLKTDFFDPDAFDREDDRPDETFYQKPRLVHHIDDTAREMVKNTHERFIADGMKVLDLMASWQSHVPNHLQLAEMVGLGLNAEELRDNSRLSDFMVHDLNADTRLPLESNRFDAVINTASIEYLIHPVEIFKEVNRILKPNGYFIVTFSNRWFPTKAIKIWKDIHEFERMGLVMEYFLQAGGFTDLHTYSVRGLPRPFDDKYFPELAYSDPVYAVWGQKP